MQLVLFLFFIAVPIAEIALFIQAGEMIGTLPTIAITIGTAIAGSFLMRVQGFATMSRFFEAANRGEMPITPVIDGIGILSAGLLLLTPGLLTDTVGLLLFVPPVRRGLARWAFRNALKKGNVRFTGFQQTQGGQTTRDHGPGHTSGPGFNKPSNDNVVDAEFETVNTSGNKDEGTPLETDDEKPNAGSKKDTPRRRS